MLPPHWRRRRQPIVSKFPTERVPQRQWRKWRRREEGQASWWFAFCTTTLCLWDFVSSSSLLTERTFEGGGRTRKSEAAFVTDPESSLFPRKIPRRSDVGRNIIDVAQSNRSGSAPDRSEIISCLHERVYGNKSIFDQLDFIILALTFVDGVPKEPTSTLLRL